MRAEFPEDTEMPATRPPRRSSSSLRSPKDKDDKDRRDIELAAYGSDARSELGSK